jgi:hypothetical protein
VKFVLTFADIGCNVVSVTDPYGRILGFFPFYLQSGKQKKVGWVGKFPGEKGSVRRCIVAMQQSLLLLPKFGEKSWHVFTQ